MGSSARKYFAFAGLLTGIGLSLYLLGPLASLVEKKPNLYESAGFVALGSLAVTIIFAFGGPPIARTIVLGLTWAKERLVRLPISDILVGVGGLIVGLIIANLLAPALSRIPVAGSFLPTVGVVVLGYIGIAVAVSKKEDLAVLIPPRLRQPVGKRAQTAFSGSGPKPKILDTSTIIDGRFCDVCKTGFVDGPIIVPSFVLDELRHIADSADAVKRNKGRRGLEVLNILQKELPLEVAIKDWPDHQDLDVDSRLVKMAKELGASIVTTDYNLAKIAELQEVSVLNINELANALKPIVTPGEEIYVNIIKEGKEPGQGVGYLEDGTMVVVDGGKRHIGDTILVVVTNCHTTPAGRMIFARPKPQGQEG
ncbi:MAG: TRAM domain-containing protein [Firmicutes bacterium]|nr:TRAM domain-containing protein [Candidatus Fermentithermobacillaceae bacterium]